MRKKKPPPRPAHRPEHEPTEVNRRVVEWGTMLGQRQDELARVIGIAPGTLRKHYRPELDEFVGRIGRGLMQTSVMRAQGIVKPGAPPDFDKVSEPMLKFLLERWYGFGAKLAIKHSGGVANYDPEMLADILSEEELRTYASLADKIDASHADTDHPEGDDPSGAGDQGAEAGEG
jgi:hypothetical protein